MKTLFVNRNVIVSIFTAMLLIYGLQGISYGQEAPDNTVEFSDTNLAREVRETLGLPTGDGVEFLKIPKAELAMLTKLIAVSDGIIDLTGLEHATQLKELTLQNNRIRDISPLAGLTNLTWLHLSNNKLRDISPLTGLTNLDRLYLSYNQLRDISPLAGLTNLTWLYLTNNLIHDVTPLENLIYLESLHLENNPIKDTSPLRILLAESPNVSIDIAVVGPGPVVEFSDVNLAKAVRKALKLYVGDDVDILNINKGELAELKYLEYDLNLATPIHERISNLTGLEHATGLITLSLIYNNITDITPLAQLTQLTTLNLKGNNISDITPIKGLSKLSTLILERNEISDIMAVSDLTHLKTLSFGNNYNTGNHIDDITPLSNLVQLQVLRLAYNNISDISPLTKLKSLKELNLSNNLIRDIQILSQLTGLIELILGSSPESNSISDLTPLSNLNLLRTLYLSGNNVIDTSPLSSLIQLRELHLSYNLIEDVSPLVSLVNLRSLFLVRNLIGDITPLAKLTDETTIFFSYNKDTIIGVPESILGKGRIKPSQIVVPEPTIATISVSPSSVVSPDIGEQLTFALNIESGEAVAGYQATIQFDGTALRYVSSAIGDFLPAGAISPPVDASGNTVTLGGVSLGGESNGDGTLATITFEIIEVKESALTLSDALLSDSAETASTPQVEDAQIVEPPQLKEDVNGDGVVNILDLVRVASSLGKSGENGADVNGDGIVNILDLVAVAGALGNTAAAPSAWGRDLEAGLTRADVQQWIAQARGLDLTDAAQKGIVFLEQLAAALTPERTALLPNYPNPFNPETWIPYHLARDAEVRIAIYDINGAVMRILDLGRQQAGFYTDKGSAVYWDGRDRDGEPVASGIYFYTLSAADFAVTRRMLIRK